MDEWVKMLAEATGLPLDAARRLTDVLMDKIEAMQDAGFPADAVVDKFVRLPVGVYSVRVVTADERATLHALYKAVPKVGSGRGVRVTPEGRVLLDFVAHIVDSGISYTKIARILDLSPGAVSAWFKE